MKRDFFTKNVYGLLEISFKKNERKYSGNVYGGGVEF